MKKKFLLTFLALLAIQAAILGVLWNSPAQAEQRARIPSATPYPTNYPPGAEPPRWTPIPTLIPATLAAPAVAGQSLLVQGQCSVYALDLIGAWVKAGKAETASFTFIDEENRTCQATFARDVQPLFSEPNIWYPGAIACTTCHGSEFKLAPANLSLVDYQNILAGSRRSEANPPGQDILGDNQTWEKSRLYIQLFTKQMPVGRPSSSPARGPLIRAGSYP